jgi:hypothetical protein
MTRRRPWFLAGLFLTTLATLTLETLNTRLLSVLTWYHLSFFAVSVAMLGMAAGAVHVYLGGERFSAERAPAALVRSTSWFAVSIPIGHLLNLSIPILTEVSVNALVSLALCTVALAGPFYLSGIAVALALTRVPGRIGLVYAVDLVGAALGSLLILPLLELGSITSSVLFTAALAGLGALCFALFAQRRFTLQVVAMVTLALLGMLNATSSHRLRIAFSKDRPVPKDAIAHEQWSVHGQVISFRPSMGPPPFWAKSPNYVVRSGPVESVVMLVDGAAGTSMTRWSGDDKEVEWTRGDITAMPYTIRRGGDVAVIGVGGGRDVLTAIWGEARSVTGIEINRAFLDLHRGRMRKFTHLADDPRVRLVHDEARSYLTRTRDQFDVLQMSLIDTWAATGAGAFTLSENGLYTTEAWDVFLSRLKPGGVFSVSRWYSPTDVSETSRLVSLATASLIHAGAEDPSKQLILASLATVATLLVSNQPFTEGDLLVIEKVAKTMRYELLLAPGRPPADARLGAIAGSRTRDALLAAVADERFDYTPPSDDRPYFFNVLKPTHPVDPRTIADRAGVVGGNLMATMTLAALLLLVTLLVVVVILGPLLRSGLPTLSRSSFALSVAYFGLIGMGFMLIQIGLIQRFSVYLGHPTYAVAVILFSMILSTGLGSLVSDRIPIEQRSAAVVALPLGTAGLVLIESLALGPVIVHSIQLGLFARCLVTIGMVSPLAFMLGMFFPMGMRLVRRLSEDAMPWMWGINGACGVLASVVAVAISMWAGIHTNFTVALLAYALLALPALALWRRGAVAPAAPLP